jgi:hypothetical protein
MLCDPVPNKNVFGELVISCCRMCDGVAIYCVSCYFIISFCMLCDPVAITIILGELLISYCTMCDGVAIYCISC